jgi:hypothetical protein
MNRRPALRIALGLLLLALAAGSMVIVRGITDAAGGFRSHQAEWQRGLEPAPAPAPGPAQRTGELLLGIGARSDVLRVYENYHAGLADVIEGTTYPQTRARFEAIKALERLRPSLSSSSDRASSDVVLGVILTEAASSAGPQRETLQKNALAAFSRAARENPTNTTAKLDLEVLLQAIAARTKSPPKPSGSTSRRRQNGENPRNPTAPARAEGEGF